MKMRHWMILAGTILSATPLVASPAPSPGGYAVTGSIPGPDGRWDYASFDETAGLLFVARGDSVTVIDPARPDSARSIGTISHGHAAIPVTPEGTLLVTSGNDNTARLIDWASGSEKARITVGNDPDAALFDRAHQRLAIMNAKGGTVSIIDPRKISVTRTIMLKPGLEFGQVADDTLYVNNEDENEIERANLTTGTASAPIALPGCEEPSGLAYDATSHQLISACANGKAAVVDTKAGKLVSLLDIGLGPDAVILDAARRRAFIPCGKSGELAVIALDSGPAHVIGLLPTEQGAKTGTLDPRDGTIYLPTAHFAPATTPNGRPTAVPGSFHVLVIKRM